MAPKDNGTYESIPTHEIVETDKDTVSSPSLKRRFLAELFGTCTLVQLGCASCCISLYGNNLTSALEVGVVWGIALALALYVSASLSGGHLNPALTLSFALVRPSPDDRVLVYWLAQMMGAFLAGCINFALFHTAIASFETEHDIVRGSSASSDNDSIVSASAFGDYWSLNDKYVDDMWQATLVEAFGTSVFFFVIFTVTNSKNTSLPPAMIPPIVGMTLGVLVTLLGPLTGAGLNPARDLGPRFVTLLTGWGVASFRDVLPYLIGPIIGGPVGAFLAEQLYSE